MGQTISIDPKMWATIRKLAFDRQTTASKIVTDALTRYLDQLENPAVADKPRGYPANKPALDLSTVDGVPTVFESLPPAPVTVTDGQSVTVGAVIRTPADVKAALANAPVREFRPVPKPVFAKKSSRGRKPKEEI